MGFIARSIGRRLTKALDEAMQTPEGKAAPLPANRDADLGDTGPDDVQFVDPRHGWTITFDGAVYRTADAGRHWAVSDPFG
jgi:hypothetical protein